MNYLRVVSSLLKKRQSDNNGTKDEEEKIHRRRFCRRLYARTHEISIWLVIGFH